MRRYHSFKYAISFYLCPSDEGKNRWLDQYIIEVKDDIMKNLKRDFKNNMTKQEAKAMNDLLLYAARPGVFW
jgi:hypothetical protein